MQFRPRKLRMECHRQFQTGDVLKLLHNKFVIVIGDSIHRAIYKDLVLLVQENRFLTRKELKSKGEISFLSDELIEGGIKEGLSNGISYKEVREFKDKNIHIRFYFVTRCYNSYVKSILLDVQEKPIPEIIIMNSCLWDVSRYGRDSMVDYRSNILSLFCDLQNLLPPDTLAMWNTTLPVSQQAKGGFLPPEKEYKHCVLSANIEEANMYTKSAANVYGIQVLDLYFHLWNHGELQVEDGIHWDMIAHRFITNLILEMVCDFFGSHSRVHFRPAPNSVYCRPQRRNVERYRPNPAAIAAYKGILTPDQTPVRSNRRHPGIRSRRRNDSLQSPDSSWAHSDFQSPYSDRSGFDFQSPASYNSFDDTHFQSPDIFQSPLSFHSDENSFYSSHSYQSPQMLASSPRPTGFYPSPNMSLSSLMTLNTHQINSLTNCLNRLDRQAPNGRHDRQTNTTYSRYQQPLLPSPRFRGFPNLGQYNDQDRPSGAMRHSSRNRRRNQPYR